MQGRVLAQGAGVPRRPAQAVPGNLERTDRLAMTVLGFWLVLVICLQRFGLAIGGSTVFVSLFFGPLMLGLLLLSGRLVVHGSSFCLLLLLLAILLPSQALLATRFSPSSLALFLIMILPYAFRIDPRLDLYPFAVRRFRAVMLVAAGLGIYQFFGQFVLPAMFVFPIDELVPTAFLKRGYLFRNPLFFGSPYFKSNGVLFLEPSFFSQSLALGIIVELLYFGSLLRLAVLALALVLTFSGTGLMVLAIALPLIVLKRSLSVALGIVGAGIVVLVLASVAAPEMVEAYTNRFGELGTPGTSGYARFTLPLLFALDEIMSGRAMVGLGAGGIEEFRILVATEGALFDPTWFKLLIEYGIPSFLLFLVLLVHRLIVSSRSGVLGAALFVLFTVTGGYLVDPNQHALLATLLVLHGNRAFPTARRPVDFPR